MYVFVFFHHEIGVFVSIFVSRWDCLFYLEAFCLKLLVLRSSTFGLVVLFLLSKLIGVQTTCQCYVDGVAFYDNLYLLMINLHNWIYWLLFRYNFAFKYLISWRHDANANQWKLRTVIMINGFPKACIITLWQKYFYEITIYNRERKFVNDNMFIIK